MSRKGTNVATVSHASQRSWKTSSSPLAERSWPVLARIPDLRVDRVERPESRVQSWKEPLALDTPALVSGLWTLDSYKQVARVVVLVVLLSAAGISLALMQQIQHPSTSSPDILPVPSTDQTVRTTATEVAPLPHASDTLASSIETTEGPYPTTRYPSATLQLGARTGTRTEAGTPWLAVRDPLPTVRTTSAAPAVAHLPGYIAKPQPRHAKHDTHESSVH